MYVYIYTRYFFDPQISDANRGGSIFFLNYSKFNLFKSDYTGNST